MLITIIYLLIHRIRSFLSIRLHTAVGKERFLRRTFLFRVTIENMQYILIIDLDIFICIYSHIIRLRLHYTDIRPQA